MNFGWKRNAKFNQIAADIARCYSQTSGNEMYCGALDN
jgi:hypothetical protein